MSDQNRVAVGEINSPWGIKGHVKVTPLTSNPERLQPKQKVFVGDLSLIITDAKIVGKIPVIQFSSFTTRNSVESLKGSLIEILEKDLPELPENIFYIHDIVGLTVFTDDEEVVGEVIEVLQTGANDVYVIRPSIGKDVLIPALESVIVAIKIEDESLIIRSNTGLFD
ncbi:MAG: ribosome maturation factor RimM [Dehalococcoidia bacterium]|nr:ribosome maturation factor RimM [Dehalococcoidia bacterium]